MSGLTLTVNGQALALAPLSFKALRAQKENIQRMGLGAFTDAYQLFETMAAIVHASLERNSPGLTLDQVEEALDEPTAELLVDEVLRISFPKLQAGEMTAESPSGSSTGMP